MSLNLLVGPACKGLPGSPSGCEHRTCDAIAWIECMGCGASMLTEGCICECGVCAGTDDSGMYCYCL